MRNLSNTTNPAGPKFSFVPVRKDFIWEKRWKMFQYLLEISAILLLLPCQGRANDNNNSSATYRLVTTLMTNYSKLIRPAESASETIIVRYGMALQQIIDMDERNQILTTSVWLRQHWTDASFKWNPDDFDGITKVTLPSTDVWKPDIVLYNIADDTFEGIMKTNVEIHYHGEVTWYAPAIFKSACSINMYYFPFDEQVCHLQFGSWAFDTSKLDLVNRSQSGDVASFIPNGEWDLQGMPVERVAVKYNCCPTPFAVLTFRIVVRRKPLLYAFNVLIPCLLVSALTLLTFFLPADACEKVTLCITILLSMSVFLLLASETMPPTSLVVPLISQYYMGTIILVSFSTILSILVLYVSNYGNYTEQPSAFMKKLMMDFMATLVGMRSCRETAKSKPIPRIRFERASPYTPERHADRIPSLSGEIDTLKPNGNAKALYYNSRQRQLYDSLQSVAGHLCSLVQNADEAETSDEHNLEWVQMALILDRFFMFAFVVEFVAFSIILFLQVGHQEFYEF
ncbi:neuronal acetylcholine receptor subunit alpha-10-like isoform X2 [Apostichopus japonicus]|uniref:neuronal acetylcholine receptor subunit alpha-10-like isoform X2 n=1 Tax=Stichopus japonicus TaxID=307972 RepID=UPI003AB2C65D